MIYLFFKFHIVASSLTTKLMIVEVTFVDMSVSSDSGTEVGPKQADQSDLQHGLPLDQE